MRRNDFVWEGGGLIRMPCLECGENFSAKRCDAKFCSPNCRKSYSRRKAKINQAAQDALRCIQAIQRTQRERPDLDWECHQALKTLKESLGVTTGVSQLVVQRDT